MNNNFKKFAGNFFKSNASKGGLIGAGAGLLSTGLGTLLYNIANKKNGRKWYTNLVRNMLLGAGTGGVIGAGGGYAYDQSKLDLIKSQIPKITDNNLKQLEKLTNKAEEKVNNSKSINSQVAKKFIKKNIKKNQKAVENIAKVVNDTVNGMNNTSDIKIPLENGNLLLENPQLRDAVANLINTNRHVLHFVDDKAYQQLLDIFSNPQAKQIDVVDTLYSFRNTLNKGSVLKDPNKVVPIMDKIINAISKNDFQDLSKLPKIKLTNDDLDISKTQAAFALLDAAYGKAKKIKLLNKGNDNDVIEKKKPLKSGLNIPDVSSLFANTKAQFKKTKNTTKDTTKNDFDTDAIENEMLRRLQEVQKKSEKSGV